MQPALQPGDRVLVATWLRPRPGDIVACRDPEARNTFLLKRIQSLTAEGSAEVRGDNPNVSHDSRYFGPVPKSLVVGRVIYRYLPAHRRGSL
jgi:nickel-type superoxide dismutase maturation protease